VVIYFGKTWKCKTVFWFFFFFIRGFFTLSLGCFQHQQILQLSDANPESYYSVPAPTVWNLRAWSDGTAPTSDTSHEDWFPRAPTLLSELTTKGGRFPTALGTVLITCWTVHCAWESAFVRITVYEVQDQPAGCSVCMCVEGKQEYGVFLSWLCTPSLLCVCWPWRSQIHGLGGFVEAPLCRHDWLHQWPLVINPSSSPASPAWRLGKLGWEFQASK
jgi:hypothetical protein